MAEETGTAGEKTFTQADVDRIVRERLARERDRFADYDDLKAKAGEADKNKSQLDKLLEKVSGLEERASKAEAAAMRADVAQAKGLTPAQARRLQGKTREELESDADELLSMFKPEGKDGGGQGEGTEGAGNDTGTGESKPADTRATGAQATTRTRPREALRSGAAVPTGGQEETDPMKLAAMVPRL